VPTAYVLMICEPGSDDYVVSQLKSIPAVKVAHGIFGSYDVIAKLEEDTEERLNNVITKQIRKMEKVRSTLSLYAVGATDLFLAKSKQEEKNWKKFAHAYIVIHCEDADEYNILRNLSQLPEVVDGDVVVGLYEVICKVTAQTYNDIEEVVSKKIRKIKHIKSTMTLNIIPENG